MDTKKKGSGCGVGIISIIIVFMLLSCNQGNHSTSTSTSDSSQNTSNSTTNNATVSESSDNNTIGSKIDHKNDVYKDDRISRYIKSLTGEWMYMQSNGNEIHYIFNSDQSGYVWGSNNEPTPMHYVLSDVNESATKAFLICEGDKVNLHLLIDTSNSANGTIRNMEYEMWHPNDR